MSLSLKDIDPSTLGTGDLQALISLLQHEYRGRLIDQGDPDTIIAEFFQDLFTKDGVAKGPLSPIPGLILLGNGHTEINSKGHHTCKNFGVRSANNGAEYWAWDESNPLFLHSVYAKRERGGSSVSLFTAVDDTILVQYSMKKGAHGHEGRLAEAWHVRNVVNEETGEITATDFDRIPGWSIGALPVPVGESDDRTFESKHGGTRRPPVTPRARVPR